MPRKMDKKHWNLELKNMDQLTLFGAEKKKFINLKEASHWASQYLNRKVTVSNISYLLQYGSNGNPLISIEELKI